MRLSHSKAWVGRCAVALAVIAGAAVLSSAARKSSFTPRDKAYYADQNTINFVRPGLTIDEALSNAPERSGTGHFVVPAILGGDGGGA